MAKPRTSRIESEEIEERARPARTMIALVVGFLALTGIAVWTVLLPELADEAPEEEAPAGPSVPSASSSAAPPPS